MSPDNQSDPVEAMKQALRHAIEIIEQCVPADALGIETDKVDGSASWPLRDEYLHNFRSALAAAEAAGWVMVERAELADAWAIADGDLDFTPPLRFEFAQGSDQTGEYYTSVAKFIDASGKVIMDITYDGDWVDTQMHAIAAVLSVVRRLQAASLTPQEKEQKT